MISIQLNDEHRKIIADRAPSLDIGGFSNLASNDLGKATREDFQITGIAGELAWYLFRHGNESKFIETFDHKANTIVPKGKGDNGFDDSITFNNKTRFVDIKSSHVENEDKIQYLNLVIPQREYHNNMIYICAFTVGKDRRNVDRVILAGWETSEYITDRWKYDNNKFAVQTKNLRPMKELDRFIR